MTQKDVMCQECNCISYADALLLFSLLEVDQMGKLIIARRILTLKSPIPQLIYTAVRFSPCVINRAIHVS